MSKAPKCPVTIGKSGKRVSVETAYGKPYYCRCDECVSYRKNLEASWTGASIDEGGES